jgi:tRNA/tmRNA/rRNA uracil-C5-methylase (TrmA/RlmC/RlmD family)
LISNALYSQTLIEGYIRNRETSKGVYASVVLKDENGKIIAYTNTKNEGYFELKTSLKGVFNLNVSSLSYEAQSIKIVIDSNTSNIKKNIVLTPKATELKEVVIQTRRPITVKKDTVVFDAKSFTQGNEQVVEDLLKKYQESMFSLMAQSKLVIKK